VSPVSRKPLEVFCKYFDRYVLSKSYVPMDVEICWIDSLRVLERSANKAPRLKLVGNVTTLVDAEDMIRQLEGVTVRAPGLMSVAEGDEEEEDAEDHRQEEEQQDLSEQEEEESPTELLTRPRDILNSKPTEVVRTTEDDKFDADFSKLMRETLDNASRSHLVGSAAVGMCLRGSGCID